MCGVDECLICHIHSKSGYVTISVIPPRGRIRFRLTFTALRRCDCFLFNLIFGSAQMLDWLWHWLWLWRHLCLCSDCCLCQLTHTHSNTHSHTLNMQMPGCQNARPTKRTKGLGSGLTGVWQKGSLNFWPRLKCHGAHYSPGWPRSPPGNFPGRTWGKRSIVDFSLKSVRL